MSDSDDDIPDLKTCQKLCEQFAEITDTDEACAQFFLQDRSWDLQKSVDAYFKSQVSDTSQNSTNENEGLPAVVPASVTDPSKLQLMTWNIDGLDKRNLDSRIKEISKIIEYESPDVVFLQEVIPKTHEYLEKQLSKYRFITQMSGEYFTATLLKKSCIVFENMKVEPFENSCMGRDLLCVNAHIGQNKFLFINSHLESTREFSEERQNQFRIMVKKILSADSDVNVICGGDLNLRNKEAEGLPSSISDLWQVCGKRKECEFTWDAMRNINIQIPGKYRPRARFDRVYFRPSSPSNVIPTMFQLLGIQKVPGTQCFPSDHWGILITMDLK